MKFENIAEDLPLLYGKAKKSFDECIRNKDNGFLQNEVELLLNEIVVVEQDIKVVFYKMNFNNYIIEVTLLLFNGSQEIGKYLYVEDHFKHAIDDSLVFY